MFSKHLVNGSALLGLKRQDFWNLAWRAWRKFPAVTLDSALSANFSLLGFWAKNTLPKLP